MQKYIRLLSYDNAIKVIDFIKESTNDGDAYITTGGVGMDVSEKDLPKVEEYIKSLNVRYEIGDVAPHIVHKQIKDDFNIDYF